tara:strand:- start:74 stop:478 length:405 start_codon:yes stop_codon:yes gene_type:complete
MKNLFVIVTCIAIISCGSPKKRYDRLIRKYPQLVETDTVIVRDTIIREVKVPVPEYKDSFIITHDTIIETEKLIIERRGDFFGVTIKPDTITFRDTIPYEVKVPGRVYTEKSINWWLLVISFLIGIIATIFIKK